MNPVAEEKPTAVFLPGRNPMAEAWRRFRHNIPAMAGLIFLLGFLLLCLIGPWLTPFGFEEQNRSLGAASPGTMGEAGRHWLGTDRLGRDLLTRLLHGGRLSFLVAVAATMVSLFIGVTYGAIAAWCGGKRDAVMMRIVDLLYALPFTVFLILLMVIFERSLLLLFIAIGAIEWLTMARIVRGQVLVLKTRAFVEAARSLGRRSSALILRHVLPNSMGPIIVYTTLTIPNVMLLEAFVSFLGLGVQAPQASLGLLINEGVSAMESAPWLLFFPSVAFALSLLSLNFVGDGLRDAFNPKE
ncbi:MAG: ABC transporter permease [Opitutales bacterium]|nr:ABC transporter permease [Opitutales bacterium]